MSRRQSTSYEVEWPHIRLFFRYTHVLLPMLLCLYVLCRSLENNIRDRCKARQSEAMVACQRFREQPTSSTPLFSFSKLNQFFFLQTSSTNWRPFLSPPTVYQHILPRVVHSTYRCREGSRERSKAASELVCCVINVGGLMDKRSLRTYANDAKEKRQVWLRLAVEL